MAKKKAATQKKNAPKRKTTAKVTRKTTKRKTTKRKAATRKATAKKKRTGFSQVVLLGTGTPGPDPEKMGSSVAVIVNDQPYIVDFGPGIIRRTVEATRKGVRGLAVSQLTRAFLTHLHSDHTVGYPDLIFTAWTAGRREPLEVYGPPGLQNMTDHLLAAYEADIDQRLNGLEPASPEGCKVNAKEVKPGKVYEDDNVEVHAFRVSHGSWPCYGYKFICPDRTIVISGDTCKHPNVIKHAKDCDLLIHEVSSATGLLFRDPAWQKYHSSYHTLGPELAEIANAAKPKLVVLTHQLLQGMTEADLMLEIQSNTDVPIVSGKDLDIF